VVEDFLTWHDHDIPVEAVQRVEFQHDAKNYSDCLAGTVVEMMLKWGLHGNTADQGLMPCAKRHWVAALLGQLVHWKGMSVYIFQRDTLTSPRSTSRRCCRYTRCCRCRRRWRCCPEVSLRCSGSACTGRMRPYIGQRDT
jgi:hypothetical protein